MVSNDYTCMSGCPGDSAFHASCNCALTVVHIILECQQYNSVRQKYFSVTTLKELFDTVNFDDILSFLRDIHLYSSI